MSNIEQLGRLIIRLQSSQDPEEQITLIESALALEPMLEEWPYNIERGWLKATLLTNLGTAYGGRIRGERADNLERAIAAFEATLAVFTREALPLEWATIQSNLGSAYSERILGECTDNVERAIAAYEAALTVRRCQALPLDWAITQIILVPPIAGASLASARTILSGRLRPVRQRSQS